MHALVESVRGLWYITTKGCTASLEDNWIGYKIYMEALD